MIGKTISHYRVLAKIGEGAAGVVYKADDLSLGRGVALKFITPEQSWDATAMLRFQHEARMASSLNHPNICTVYEIGEHERSQFIAMELLEGDTLSHAIAGKPLTVSNLLSIGIQICDALEAAHAENVIHRDLKPANVFVTTKNQVKILDFALAQFNPARAPVEPQSVKVWGTNAAGTVPYMSPEQINRSPIDTRSDLFSVGIILYEMATGRRAFSGKTITEIQNAIVREATPEPRLVNLDIPDGLNRVIVKALEKNRDLRYQTASDLRADLRRLKRDLESHPQAIAAPPPKGRAVNWELTRYAVGIAIAVGLILTGVASFRHQNSSQPAPEPAPQPRPQPQPSVTAMAPAAPPQAAAVAPPVTTPAAPRKDVAPAPKKPAAVQAPPPPAPVAGAVAGGAEQELRIARTLIESGLQEQAATKLRELVTAHPGTQQALDGYFLMAEIEEKRNRPNDAMATYLEIAERFKANPRAAEALYRMARLTLKSQRDGKEAEARKTLEVVADNYGKTKWAPLALILKGQLEEEQDAAAAMRSYDRLASEYPKSDVYALALRRLADLCEKQKLYERAAETLGQLAKAHPGNADEAWFRSGEIYRRRLNDRAKARAAYVNVAPSSRHFPTAQRYLKAQ